MTSGERIISYSEAIREATGQEMARDPNVFVMGLGVDDFRGIYGTTKGLHEQFGAERNFDTPLSEDAMTGVAIGAAFAGLRPIHVHIRMDFLLLAMNQLINIAAKAHYMYGGAVSVPIVVRGIIGRSWGQGAQHSQGLHSMFMHVPGIKVVAPTTPYDAKGCLASSIRDDNPVVFVEHRMVHGFKGHVPEEPYTVPLGKARILSEGTDVTLVGISYQLMECVRAAQHLKKQGVSAEVIDPVTLSPLDMETILASVRKTGRLLVVDAGWVQCGASAEIVSRVIEALQGECDVRVKRVGFAPTTCPTTRNLETAYYPNAQDIARSAFGLLGGRRSWIPPHEDAPELVAFKGPF